MNLNSLQALTDRKVKSYLKINMTWFPVKVRNANVQSNWIDEPLCLNKLGIIWEQKEDSGSLASVVHLGFSEHLKVSLRSQSVFLLTAGVKQSAGLQCIWSISVQRSTREAFWKEAMDACDSSFIVNSHGHCKKTEEKGRSNEVLLWNHPKPAATFIVWSIFFLVVTVSDDGLKDF